VFTMNKYNILNSVIFADNVFADKAMTRIADQRRKNTVGWRRDGQSLEPEKVYWNQVKRAWLTEEEFLSEKERRRLEWRHSLSLRAFRERSQRRETLNCFWPCCAV